MSAKQEGTPCGRREANREESGPDILEGCKEVGGEKGGGSNGETSSEVLSPLTVLHPWSWQGMPLLHSHFSSMMRTQQLGRQKKLLFVNKLACLLALLIFTCNRKRRCY